MRATDTGNVFPPSYPQLFALHLRNRRPSTIIREWVILNAGRLLWSWCETTVGINAKEYAESGKLVFQEFCWWQIWGRDNHHWDPWWSGCHVYNSELKYDGLGTYQIHTSLRLSTSISHQIHSHICTWSYEPAWSLLSQPSLAFWIASVDGTVRFRSFTFPFMLNSTFPLKRPRLMPLKGWHYNTTIPQSLSSIGDTWGWAWVF